MQSKQNLNPQEMLFSLRIWIYSSYSQLSSIAVETVKK